MSEFKFGTWYPIESAPNDLDMRILVFRQSGEVTMSYADGDWWRHQKNNKKQISITHWMPLPNPPEAE